MKAAKGKKKFKVRQEGKDPGMTSLRAMFMSKKGLISAFVVILVILVLASSLLILGEDSQQANEQPSIETIEASPEEAEIPVEVPMAISPLSGALVPETDSQRTVTGLVIDNSKEARPQSGLSEADVIIEAISESGGTKLLAIYQAGQPSYVGPIRSTRPQLVEWLEPFDAVHGHVGGDIAGRASVSKYVDQDLDQYYLGEPTYQRISSKPSPHNVYTNFNNIDNYSASRGYNSDNLSSFARKAEEPSETPNATNIDMRVSTASYNPSYVYNGATNSYLRSYGSSAHKDSNNNQQLSPKVVIGMVVSGSDYTAADGPRYRYQNIGSGVAYVFQDGLVTKGRWSKQSVGSQIVFQTTDGATIEINPGQTWITMINGVDW